MATAEGMELFSGSGNTPLDVHRVLGLAVAANTQVDLDFIAETVELPESEAVLGALADVVRRARQDDPGVAERVRRDIGTYREAYRAAQCAAQSVIMRKMPLYTLSAMFSRRGRTANRMRKDWEDASREVYRGMLTGVRLDGASSAGSKP